MYFVVKNNRRVISVVDKEEGMLIDEDLFVNIVCDSGFEGLLVGFLYGG